jgi:hypothetical protein
MRAQAAVVCGVRAPRYRPAPASASSGGYGGAVERPRMVAGGAVGDGGGQLGRGDSGAVRVHRRWRGEGDLGMVGEGEGSLCG